MTDHHHHHHHARLSRLRTTTQLLRQTTASFSSHPLTFIFLTFLLFSFHSLVDHCSLLLTSFVDSDPSLRSLLSRLPLYSHSHTPTRFHHHRRAPFLQLTRLGTLDDDFFSTDENDPHRRSLQGSSFRSPINATTVFLSGFESISGLSRPIADNGLLLPQIIRSGVVLRQLEKDDLGGDEEDMKLDESELDRETEKKDKEFESFVDLKMFFKGLELGRHDAAALFFLVSFLSAAYGWVILGFTTVYSLVLAIMFVTVINDLLGRFPSFLGVVWSGSRLGFKRVTGFVLMRWAVRDALTQLLGLWYFGEVEDQFSFFRLFVRLKLMPFTVMPPWIRGFEKEISGFLFAWFLLDTLVGLILAVDAFVAIVDSRRRGREIVKEGLYLISLLLHQAVQLKCLEAILCGSFFRWVLVRMLGKSFASVIQSALEVYFMAAWLVFYLAAKCKDAHADGRRFGRREMENLIDGLR
ncbi:uncharacterized protein LOC9315714 [Arabidopsis lyrata subsp. lyrata]|uniref:uncharacterized protein LOC9315714 n=1 Tax=Arabidopsis lyrata subsp. lyrata TaxID=81972 RepID=UPI000A29B326|nr:uncharacterized protein LOC9315714 [Arabidopsis lyrata subsp. lyrata]|eukprot:XP_020883837.1 uncharacterized protein LOC9315714 [Arabidopsis lyrata subsp. lyrata]